MAKIALTDEMQNNARAFFMAPVVSGAPSRKLAQASTAPLSQPPVRETTFNSPATKGPDNKPNSDEASTRLIARNRTDLVKFLIEQGQILCFRQEKHLLDMVSLWFLNQAITMKDVRRREALTLQITALTIKSHPGSNELKEALDRLDRIVTFAHRGNYNACPLCFKIVNMSETNAPHRAEFGKVWLHKPCLDEKILRLFRNYIKIDEHRRNNPSA